jgi:hypothetical protein
MTTKSSNVTSPPAAICPMATVGAILAQGVIRLVEGRDLLDKSGEERVHAVVLTTKDNKHE